MNYLLAYCIGWSLSRALLFGSFFIENESLTNREKAWWLIPGAMEATGISIMTIGLYVMFTTPTKE